VINVLIIQGIKLDAPGAEEPLVEWFKDDATSDSVNDEETGKKKLTAVEKAQNSIKELIDIGARIEEGAIEFLKAEYLYLTLFCIVFALVIGFTVDLTEMHHASSPSNFPYTATAFLIGAGTSILSGYIGMRIAVYTNNRTTY
jgi:Na+/H+-translocating membrane pyrophosphatase